MTLSPFADQTLSPFAMQYVSPGVHTSGTGAALSVVIWAASLPDAVRYYKLSTHVLHAARMAPIFLVLYGLHVY